VTEAAWQKHFAKICSDHLVNVAREQPVLCEVLQNRSRGQAVHVGPLGPWLAVRGHRLDGFEHTSEPGVCCARL
jgi:hypothetical protein